MSKQSKKSNRSGKSTRSEELLLRGGAKATQPLGPTRR